MRFTQIAAALLAAYAFLGVQLAFAQDAGVPDAGALEENPEETSDEESEGEDDLEGGLRAPQMDALAPPSIAETEPDENVADDDADPTEADIDLDDAMPPRLKDFTAPQTILKLHGYFRTRGNLMETLYLGRRPVEDEGRDYPFDRFRPGENRIDGSGPIGGCGDSLDRSDSPAACDSSSLGFANMRLRLAPVLSVSDEVRVHAMFDVFDNFILGSTPDGIAGEDSLSFSTDTRNSIEDAIRVRRAWAEVTNRGLGQIRFGRMGWHWGLGMFANGGEGIDSDYQTDVDRIMAIVNPFDLVHVIAAYDFANEGYVASNRLDPYSIPLDAYQDDDVDQYMFAVTRRYDEDVQKERLDRGDFVLNAGAFFLYRNQLLSTVEDASDDTERLVFRRGAEAFIPDVWLQFLYENLRLEVEAAMVFGSVDNTLSGTELSTDTYGLLQFGLAFEGEYRVLDDQFGIHFDFGFASGDQDLDGLGRYDSDGNPNFQRDARGAAPDDSISTFRFHPNYRVDLIFWRNIMGHVAGGYYFKPGISYDFIRDPFGQLLGFEVDLIWSRATAELQTWGNDPDLGVEINAALYYRSEDGPEIWDGFYGSAQAGVFFPMQGLGYLSDDSGSEVVTGNPDLETAWIFRFILGVAY